MKDNKESSAISRVLSTSLNFFIAFIFSFAVYLLVVRIPESLHSALNGLFPESVELYNPVENKLEYERQNRIYGMIAGLISAFISGFIATYFSGAKCHDFFRTTHGFYGVKKGLSLYLKRYSVPDVIAAVFISGAFCLVGYFLPVSLTNSSLTTVDFYVYPFLPYIAVKDSLGILSIPCVIGASIGGGACAVLPAVLRYRGISLSHSIE